MSALVTPGQWWLVYVSLGGSSPVVATMCQPWWLQPSGGWYVSALVAPAQWWLVCVSLGGSGPVVASMCQS